MSRKYEEYQGLNLPNVAQAVLEKWKNERVFEASIATREGAEPFVFFEGRHQRMVCREFTTLWLVRLKIFFVATKL